jgi:tetratricopeptide (TPR) repeat protein
MLDVMRSYAETVVCTRWPIDDDTALQFARSFYESLSRGNAIAEAIVSARRAGMRKSRWENPTWMAYMVVGEDIFGTGPIAQRLASHCSELGDLFRAKGDHIAAGAWYQRAAGFFKSGRQADARRSALENASAALQQFADYYSDQENYVESARLRFRAATTLEAAVARVASKHSGAVRARALCIRGWGFAAKATDYFFRRQYADAARQRHRASRCFFLAGNVPGVAGSGFGRKCRAYYWEYRAWRRLAIAAGAWRRCAYAESVTELGRGVSNMRRAVDSSIDEYDRVKFKGYLFYFRALMLRSHAWAALNADNYEGAIEALNEAVRLLSEGHDLFVLHRDAKWAEGNILLMIAQRELVCAILHAGTLGSGAGAALESLFNALRVTRNSQECFPSQALKQRSSRTVAQIKLIVASIARRGSCAGTGEAIRRVVTSDLLF